MSRTLESRMANIEKAALLFEGAHFCHRDLLARLLARLPEAEVRKAIQDLLAEGEAHAEELGADRLAGYREELTAIQEELAHSRTGTPGLFARLTGAR